MLSSFVSKQSCIALLSSVVVTIGGCSSSGSYRVASVGDVPGASAGDSGATADNAGGGTAGGTASSGSGAGSPGAPATTTQGTLGGVLVSAGNAVIGTSSLHNGVGETINGVVPGSAPVTGTVTAVLAKTGQTVVDLGSGRSLLLDSARGKVGEVVSIDLGSKTVIAASGASSLVGVGILSPTPATGTVAAANLGTGIGTPDAVVGVVSPVVTTVTNAASGAPTTGGVLAPVTSTLGGIGIGAAGGAAVTTPKGRGGLGGVLGIGGK